MMLRRAFPWIAGVVLATSACRSNTTTPQGPVAPTLRPTTSAAVGAVDLGVSASPARNLPITDGCGSGHIGALGFVPPAATLVVGIDVRNLVNQPFYAAHRDALEVGGFKQFLDITGSCGLGRGAWQTVTLGLDTTKNASTFVIQADGIGAPDRLECLRTAALAAGQKEPFVLVRTDDRTELTMADGGHGWAVDRCTLVVAAANFVDATRARLEGVGAALLEGPMMTTVNRAGVHRPLWAAASSLTNISSGGSGALGGARDLALSVELQRGFAFEMSMGFPDGPSAQAASAKVTTEFAGFKSMLPTLGVPQAVVDSINISAAGAFVNVAARGDEAALESMRVQITKMMVGG